MSCLNNTTLIVTGTDLSTQISNLHKDYVVSTKIKIQGKNSNK